MAEPSATKIVGNKIKQFLLRIDFQSPANAVYGKVIDAISADYDRVERRQAQNINVHVDAGSAPKLTQTMHTDFVLISEARAISLTFSEVQNAVIVEASRYTSKAIYEDVLKKLVAEFSNAMPTLTAKRVGMRFVNEFPCKSVVEIGRVFERRLASSLRNMLDVPNAIRLISMEERNLSGYKTRIQYGIPNRFYPETIRIYDLLLDIDSFLEVTVPISEWPATVDALNHAAYREFVAMIRPSYLELLRQ